jgi:hypothetical protein
VVFKEVAAAATAAVPLVSTILNKNTRLLFNIIAGRERTERKYIKT